MRPNELLKLLIEGRKTGAFWFPETATDDDLMTVLNLVARREYQVDSLDLAETQVGDAGVQALAQSTTLTALDWLILSKTQVGDPGVQALALSTSLTALEWVALNETQVGDAGVHALAQSTSLAALKSLDLSGTQVTDAGVHALAQSTSLTALRHLNLTGTQVNLPEQLIRSFGAQTILQFFRETRMGRALFELKVVILGPGRSGKTLLGQHLAPRDHAERNGPFRADQESTHAFERRDLDLVVERGGDSHKCRVRLFDFGGQPEMHGAHRFFLADQRNVYLVLVSARKDRAANRLDYWLGMVRHYGNGAPAVVVVTHCDDQPAAGDHLQPLADRSRQQCLETLDAEELSAQHRIPVAVVDGYSNCTGANLQAVRDAIARAIANLDVVFDVKSPTGFSKVEKHPVFDVKFPNGLFQVKEWLEGRPPDELADHASFETYLPVDSFRDVCVACGQKDGEQQHVWLKLLRDMGLVHWVGDRPEVQRNAGHALAECFFHPEWVKNPVYDVVRNNTAIHGIISQARLDAVLEKGGIELEEARRDVTALMLACELCFKVQGGNPEIADYLVVDQVDTKPPDVELKWPPNPLKKLIWQFDFLPDHLLTQLLGRWFPWRDKELNTYYRDEIVLRSRDTETCRLRLAARPASHVLELEYHAKLYYDQERMHAKIESEVESLLDPEVLKRRDGKKLWDETPPKEELRKTLTDEDEKIVAELAQELVRITKIASDNEIDEPVRKTKNSFDHEKVLRDHFQDRLRKRFTKSLKVTQPRQRLAYRACYVASCAWNLAKQNDLDQGFPLEPNTDTTTEVLKWLSENPTIKAILLKSVDTAGQTLEGDSLRKLYNRALKELRETPCNAEIGDLHRHAPPHEYPRTDDDRSARRRG